MSPHEKRQRLIADLEALKAAAEKVRDDVADLDDEKSREMATLRSARIEDLGQLINDFASWLAVMREAHGYLTSWELEKKN